METVDEVTVTAEKYVDDLTTFESIPRTATHYMDEAYEKKYYKAEKNQKNLFIAKLKQTCNERGLKINPSKTQLLAISANREKLEYGLMKQGRTLTPHRS